MADITNTPKLDRLPKADKSLLQLLGFSIICSFYNYFMNFSCMLGNRLYPSEMIVGISSIDHIIWSIPIAGDFNTPSKSFLSLSSFLTSIPFHFLGQLPRSLQDPGGTWHFSIAEISASTIAHSDHRLVSLWLSHYSPPITPVYDSSSWYSIL